jgi:hypothetical protein
VDLTLTLNPKFRLELTKRTAPFSLGTKLTSSVEVLQSLENNKFTQLSIPRLLYALELASHLLPVTNVITQEKSKILLLSHPAE